ncbi:unnamed protein product [Sympodiomycopsis kandeliae]
MVRLGMKRSVNKAPSRKKTSSSNHAGADSKIAKSNVASQKSKQKQQQSHKAAVKSKGNIQGARDDINKTFDGLRNGRESGAALKIHNERPKAPKLSQSTSKQSQDQLLQTFESLMT